MVHQVDVICKNEFTQQRSAAYAQMMLRELHKGGDYFYYSTKAPFGGYEQDWRKVAGGWLEPKPTWVDGKHLYFSVNPHLEIPKFNGNGDRKSPKWVRGTVANIAAINALFVEIDAKDMIRQDEWLAQYVEPDLTGIEDEPQKVRGAFQKAQTAAIEATLPMHLAEFKQRALAKMMAAPLRPSACWDSGGGYQAVWMLDKTLPITDDNRALICHVQKQWVALNGGDPAASDLNRVLRLPGGTNRKTLYGPNGQPVLFLWCELERVHTFADLAAMVPAVPEKKAAQVRRIYIPAGYDPKLGEFSPVPDLPRHPAITEYNTKIVIRDLLEECGYTDAGGGRMSRPGQPSSAGVQINADNTANFFSGADPLYCEHRITAAQALCVYRFNSDVPTMLDWLTNGRYGTFLVMLDRVRYFVRTVNFATVEPTLLSVAVDGTERYPSDSTDTKIGDALCDEWLAAGCFTTKAIGKKRLAAAAGVATNSAQKAVERLARFLVTTEDDPDGYGVRITLNSCRFKQFDPLFVDPFCDTGIKLLEPTPENTAAFLQLDVDEYAPRKAHDVFQSGVSRHVRILMRQSEPGDWWKRPEGAERQDPVSAMWDKVDDLTPEQWEAQRDIILADMDAALKRKPKPTREQRAWDKRRSGLGEKALRVLDVLNRLGDMTAQEIADECGISLSTARTTLARLYTFAPDYITKTREGSRGKTVYGIMPEVFDDAESRAHELKTHKMAACREDKRLEAAQLWAKRSESQAANPAAKRAAAARGNKLANKRADVLADLHEMTPEAAHRAARDLPVKQWTQKRAAMAQAHQESVEREEFRQRIDHIANLQADSLTGLTRSEASRLLRMGGYDAADTHLILEHLVEKGGVLKTALPMVHEVKAQAVVVDNTQMVMV